MRVARPPELRASRLTNAVAILAPAAVALAVFATTLRNGLLYDDPAALARAAAPMRALVLQRYGLTSLSIRVDRMLWDAWPPGLHLTNVLLHGVSTALAAGCALALTRETRAALVTGLLFAVHPVHVEAVASIENRKEMLAFAFVAASLLLQGVRPRRAWSSLAALAALALALGAKDVAAAGAAVMLPAAGVLYDDAESMRRRLARGPRRALAPLLLGGAATVWYAGNLAARFTPEAIGQATAGLCQSYGQVLLASVSAVPEVARLLFFPLRLSADYPARLPSGAGDPVVLLGIVVLLGAVTTAFLVARSAPVATFAIAWVWVMYLPLSNLVPLTPYFVAERYLYVPSFGACLLAAVCGVAAYERAAAARPSHARAVALGVLVLVVGELRAAARSRDWRDELSLWTSAVDAVPAASGRAHNELGRALWMAGRSSEAIPHLQRALDLGMDTPDTRSNLGMALLGVGRLDEAIGEFARALDAWPANPLIRFNLAWTLLKAGRREEALPYLRELATEAAWSDLSPAVIAALAARGASPEGFRSSVRRWLARQGY